MTAIIQQNICLFAIYKYIPIVHITHMKKTSPIQALQKAIDYFGTGKDLAAAINVEPCYISKMKRDKHVPWQQCKPIEQATGGLVKAAELNPKVFG
jgi:hypothetical protein